MSQIGKMDYEDMFAPVLLLLMAAAYRQYLRNRRRKRLHWVKPWIKRRGHYGAHHALLTELSTEATFDYHNFVRMRKEDFDELLFKVTPLIERKETHLREPISPAERLSITLRYLATGDSYKSLMYLYRIPANTLSVIIPETAAAIYSCLKLDYLKVPSTPEEWSAISKQFSDVWQFPNCIGAMDGKHVAITRPKNSGSSYFNYKQFYSIVLFALVDADYKFIYVDCGCNGRISDGGVFANSSLYHALEQNSINIPGRKALPERQKALPHVIVGDDAFPLKTYIMKPYPTRDLDEPKRIFNYRLSRARRIVENVFGILSNRFRIFTRPIPLEPEKAEQIVLACCALHNYLRTKSTGCGYINAGLLDEEDLENRTLTPGTWRQEGGNNLPGLEQQGGNRSSENVREIREEFCDYFNTNGQVPWQWDMI